MIFCPDKSMKKLLFILIFLFGCTIKSVTVNWSNDGAPVAKPGYDEKTDVTTDAKIPVTGQGMATTQE